MTSHPQVSLCPIERGDLDFLTALANDPEVRRRVVGWDWPLARSGQEAWFERMVNSSTERRFVVLDEAGRRIGMTGLWDIDFRNRTALTAVKLGGSDDVRGHGYGTATVRAITEFAFDDVGLNRLHSTILATNSASLVVFIGKSGWSEEGRLRQHVWRDGGFVDLVQIGILRDEYLVRRASS